MEKLSLNEVLALLMPGLFVLFSIQVFDWSLPPESAINPERLFTLYHDNDFLNSLFFLLLATVSGAMVQKITVWAIEHNWYNRFFGLYRHSGYLFFKDELLQDWLPFYNKDCRQLFGASYDGSSLPPAEDKQTALLKVNEVQGKYFDYLYYYLIAKDKITDARTQQNYYYLFRNLFTVSAAAFIAGCGLVLLTGFRHCWYAAQYPGMAAAAFFLFAVVVCRPLGKWYRRRMIRILFYTYYIERNSTPDH